MARGGPALGGHQRYPGARAALSGGRLRLCPYRRPREDRLEQPPAFLGRRAGNAQGPRLGRQLAQAEGYAAFRASKLARLADGDSVRKPPYRTLGGLLGFGAMMLGALALCRGQAQGAALLPSV